ncbi:hypothetical protein NL529_31800, partial [Klebsiella pneumoniae]|nr:hypothetical protein [Klebsiella pneumoniae]
VLIAPAGDDRSYVFAITRDRADWQPIPYGSTALEQKVATFRRSLDVDVAQDAMKSGDATNLFNLEFAHELYLALLGPVESQIK